MSRYPSFNISTWVPPTFRSRVKDGVIYSDIRYNRITKTLVYNKTEKGKTTGPYHGFRVNDFLKMEESKKG